MLPIASCSINWDKLLTLQLDVQYYNTCSLNVKLNVFEVKLQLSLSFLTAVSSWSGSRSHIINCYYRRNRHENTLLCSGSTKLFWAERYNDVDDIFVMHWAGGLYGKNCVCSLNFGLALPSKTRAQFPKLTGLDQLTTFFIPNCYFLNVTAALVTSMG